LVSGSLPGLTAPTKRPSAEKTEEPEIELPEMRWMTMGGGGVLRTMGAKLKIRSRSLSVMLSSPLFSRSMRSSSLRYSRLSGRLWDFGAESVLAGAMPSRRGAAAGMSESMPLVAANSMRAAR